MPQRPPRRKKNKGINLINFSDRPINLNFGLALAGVALLLNVAIFVTGNFFSLKQNIDKNSFLLEQYNKEKDSDERLDKIEESLDRLETNQSASRGARENSPAAASTFAESSTSPEIIEDATVEPNRKAGVSVFNPNNCDELKAVLDNIKSQLPEK